MFNCCLSIYAFPWDYGSRLPPANPIVQLNTPAISATLSARRQTTLIMTACFQTSSAIKSNQCLLKCVPQECQGWFREADSISGSHYHFHHEIVKNNSLGFDIRTASLAKKVHLCSGNTCFHICDSIKTSWLFFSLQWSPVPLFLLLILIPKRNRT